MQTKTMSVTWPFNRLPRDLEATILSCLTAPEIAQARCVCESFRVSILGMPSLAARISDDRTDQFIVDHQKDFLDGIFHPVSLAAEYQEWPIVMTLIERRHKFVDGVNQIGLFQGFSALHWAVFYNQPKVVKRLLALSSDPHLKNRYGDTPLDFALRHGCHDVLRLFLIPSSPKRRKGA